MKLSNQLSRALLLMGSVLIVSIVLTCCNYPTRKSATATANAVLGSLPTEKTSTIEIPLLVNTPIISDTPIPSETPSPSLTPGATDTPLLEQVGVVILYGREIGTIQKRGEKFEYTADPNALTPEVKGKVVLQLKDPQQIWGFDLESSSYPMYSLKDDTRIGWEAYGVLMAYKGIYEITVKFIAMNGQTNEQIPGKVYIKIAGMTLVVTDTPEWDVPGLP